MDCFLLPFIFSIRAAITLLLLLQRIILPATMRFTASFIKQAFQWFLFVVNLFLTTKFGRTLWSIFSTVLCIVFIVPIVFYTFYKSRCLSQSIFTAVDFDARHAWRHYIRVRQSKLTQPRARQSDLAQNFRERQSKLTLLRARQSDLAQNFYSSEAS